MTSLSRISIAATFIWSISTAINASYAVEIPKPVINIPKPNIPRPTINVPRPNVTVNVPKPAINVPKPAVNVPKVTVTRPAINTPKAGVLPPKMVEPAVSPKQNGAATNNTTSAAPLTGTQTGGNAKSLPNAGVDSQGPTAHAGLDPKATTTSTSVSGSSSAVSEVHFPNGTFGKAVVNPDGSVTVSNNLGTVTLTKQQMPQAAAGDMSALKPLMANGVSSQTQAQTPFLNSNGSMTEIRLPNGTFGKVVMNPDGTVTLSNNLGTVTLTKQQMSRVAAGDMSALYSLMSNGQSTSAQGAASRPTIRNSDMTSGGGPYVVNGQTFATRTCNDGGCEYFNATGNMLWVPANGRATTLSNGGINTMGSTIGGRTWPYSICASPGNCQYWDSGGNSVMTMSGQIVACAGNACSGQAVASLGTGGGGYSGIGSGGGRQPIYVQDANGIWHNSYWFAPPADVLANYGPLSEASSQPVLPYGFYYPNGPPPGAVFADDSNTNSSNRNNNSRDDDPLPNPNNGGGPQPPKQEQADNSQPANDPQPRMPDKADNSQSSDDARPQDQANNAAAPGDGSKNADNSPDAPSKSLGQMATDLKDDAKQFAADLKDDAKQLASPENLQALADANADATKLREDPVGYLKDKVNEADTAAAKQMLTDQLAGPPPSNPEDQDAYKFQQGLVGKAVDNAKQTISEGGQSLKNAISQGWANFKSIFTFNSNNMDKVSNGANSIKPNK